MAHLCWEGALFSWSPYKLSSLTGLREILILLDSLASSCCDGSIFFFFLQLSACEAEAKNC